MDKFKVIGHYCNSFKDKQTGESVSYAKLFLSPLESPSKGAITGLYIEQFSVKPEVLTGVSPDDTISLLFNKYGKVQDIVSCD